jgi:hypothetical protein
MCQHVVTAHTQPTDMHVTSLHHTHVQPTLTTAQQLCRCYTIIVTTLLMSVYAQTLTCRRSFALHRKPYLRKGLSMTGRHSQKSENPFKRRHSIPKLAVYLYLVRSRVSFVRCYKTYV